MTDQIHAEMERLLSGLHSVHAAQSARGLETRVLRHLEDDKLSEPKASSPRTRARRVPALWRGWAPVAATASLLCIITGGVLVAREGALAAHSTAAAQITQTSDQLQAHAAHLSATTKDGRSANEVSRMSTAAARRFPAAPIAASHRRGRAVVPSRSR